MEQDSEMMRLQILGDPNLMRQLREVCPHLKRNIGHVGSPVLLEST